MSWKPTITKLTPTRVLVTTKGQARLRVQGKALGWLRVGRERRWVWGRFDETFVVRPRQKETVQVAVVGLGGGQRQLVASPVIDLQAPPLELSMPRVKTSLPTLRSPGLRVARLTSYCGARQDTVRLPRG